MRGKSVTCRKRVFLEIAVYDREQVGDLESEEAGCPASLRLAAHLRARGIG